MAETLNAAVDSGLELNNDIGKDSTATAAPSKSPSASSPPPPPPTQLPPRRGRVRERDTRERRDDRDYDRRGRDYYDRNRSRSPLPPPPREREYKRGRPSSHSPPPPPYRDRRGGGYSPPSRRSPTYQPYKRSRREDYDGRRGSPRGGYGPGDRRFNDYPGGYERGMGGRSGHPDERLHGRFFGRWSGGFQERDSNRGGTADDFVKGSTQREGLMSYKQFIQELEDDILPAEAERRYQEYKSEYITTQKKTYFDAHKNEEWLKDKYHPTNLLTVIERRNKAAQNLAKDFQSDLYAGTLDLGPAHDTSLSNKSGQPNDPNNDEDVDDGSKTRQQGRVPAKETDPSAAPKAHPVSSDPRRIQIDVVQAHELVRKLDLEKGIEDNILCRADNDKANRDTGPVIIVRGLSSTKGLEGVELLDTLLTYLWRIHGVDYYGLSESNEAKGLRHVRGDTKKADAASDAGEWEKRLDSYWQDRLKGRDPLEVMAAKEMIDAAAVEGLDPYVRKIRDEKYGWKYGCGAKGCAKLFHATEFVQKHLKLKHTDLVNELTLRVREDLYYQNYMRDENAPGGTPIMQPSLPKEKPMRRRFGLDNRLKDERGHQRERDNQANNEGVDRPDNSLSNKDGAPGGNLDEPMYGGFDGQGISVSDFPSDIGPPPLLMPVPGAGPLGPFVPAPPEYAMRMLREQRGPTFEDVMNGLTGPRPTGQSPFILPPTFRQDPRRLRSYQDLDAPEDEISVIDYRSLEV